MPPRRVLSRRHARVYCCWNSPRYIPLSQAIDCGAIPIISSEQAPYYHRLMPSVARHFVVLEMTCLTGARFTARTSPCFPSNPANSSRLIAMLLADHAALEERHVALAIAYEEHRRRTARAIASGLAIASSASGLANSIT